MSADETEEPRGEPQLHFFKNFYFGDELTGIGGSQMQLVVRKFLKLLSVKAMEKKLLSVEASGLAANDLTRMGTECAKCVTVTQDSLFRMQKKALGTL